MMKSPEAAKVMASYMQDQIPTAIDIMKRLGDLANATRAKEEAERLRLKSIEEKNK